MRIGLLNYTFNNENKGCDALTYSTLTMLQSIFGGNIEVVNFGNIDDCGNIKRYFPELKYSFNKLKLKDIRMKTFSEMRNCNFILDITYGDNFSDIYSEKLFRETSYVKLFARITGTPLIMMPQTIGPFQSESLLHLGILAMRSCHKIYARDELSEKFALEHINERRVFRTTDMAFQLKYDPDMYIISSNKIKLGVNVSGLLWKGGFHSDNQFGLVFSYKEYILNLISYLATDDRYDVYLIPHVINNKPGASDGDLEALKLIKERFPSCIMAPEFEDPIQAKSYISNMDIFIGARMHSTIAALSSCVATIPFAYSRKFQGLFGSLDYKYVIDGCASELEEALERTKEYIWDYRKLQKAAKYSCKIAENSIDEFRCVFKNDIMSIMS